MARQQPKKNMTKVSRNGDIWGNAVRLQYQNKIFDKAPMFPKPLEYADIDEAFFNFVDKEIDLSINGKSVPTFTIYSSQRFSEYTQMWEHSDDEGNVYLNFKTVNREKNPSQGGNQAGLWNIPGSRKYMLYQREVLDDNGTESYEVYSMSQPYAVDLMYKITFVTTNIVYLNYFNQKINKLFSARQHYIRPNGHFVPMVLDEISDETEYSINERKFYVQSATIKMMTYIIEKDDFEVKKFPKRIHTGMYGDKFMKDKPCVEVEETESETPMKHPLLNVNMTFKAYHDKLEFDFDTNMTVQSVTTTNVKSMRVMVNGTLYYTEKEFKLRDGDNVIVYVKPLDYQEEMTVKFSGYENDTYYDSRTPERVDETPITEQEINIE